MYQSALRALAILATLLTSSCQQKAKASGGGASRGGTLHASRRGASGTDGGLSLGCGLSPRQSGDFHLKTTDGAGTRRDYEVMVPSPYNPNTPLAVTFVYHGAGATQANAVAFGLQNAPGAGGASIFVFPQGMPFESYGVGWNDSCAGYDVPLFDNMLDYLEDNYCIDQANVFAAGFSWGCDQVTALACCRGNRIRAVAAASCTDEFADNSNYKTYANSPCPGIGPSAIRFTHDVGRDSSYTLQQFTSTSALYRSFNSCSATWAASSVAPCVSYQGCSAPYLECAYSNLGHSLPATWPADTWSFFSTLD
jgi:polyhydroxybutyrate depolymerase